MSETDLIIFLLVVGARFIVPLFIPRFPLPAIILCMIIDAADQTIFQKFTNINLDSYQQYDKALDIYYLGIAYLSTLKNWKNVYGFKTGRFLFYYRMIGDALFQVTNIRAVLFIFPNTFEYFFDFYEGVATRWDPKRMTKKIVILSAAFIWIFIKLPQEYWIHIAQLDTTDFIKQKIFHVPTDTTFPEIIKLYPWIIPAFVGLIIALVLIIWFLSKRLPKADWKFRFKHEIQKLPKTAYMSQYKKLSDAFDFRFFEKLAIIALISIIFASIFPDLKATIPQILIGVSLVVLVNAIVSFLLIAKTDINTSLNHKFLASFATNSAIALVYAHLAVGEDNTFGFGLVMLFAYIITVIIYFYDKFIPYYLALPENKK